MKKVKVTVIRRTEYTKEFWIDDNAFEDLCEGFYLDEGELAGDAFETMDEMIESEDWSDENFQYASDYCIQDEEGGVIVPFSDVL